MSLWEWGQTALLVANLAWTTLGRGGVRADTFLVTTVLTAALVIVHCVARIISSTDAHGQPGRGGRASEFTHPAGWWLLPFLAYAAANAGCVTPLPWRGWFDWLEWAQLIAVFWVVLNGVQSRWPRRAVFFSLVVLALVSVVLACYQRFVRPDWVMFGESQPIRLNGRTSGPFGIPNSFAGLLVLILPPVLGAAFRRSATLTQRVWWGWVAVVLLLGMVLAISRGAWVSLAIALTIWPLVAARGSWVRRLRIAVLILAAVGALGTAMYWKSPKVRARFTALALQGGEVTRPHMWRGAWQLFRDAPLLGTGGGSYNVLFERHRQEGFRDEPLWAHNEYLNTLSDYGAVGFLLFFGAAGAIAVRCIRGRREEAARRRDWLDSPTVVSGCGIGLLAFALQMALDFHLKIPALALASATLAALVVARAWPVARPIEPAPVGRIKTLPLLTTGAVGALLVFVIPMLRAESLRQEARRVIDRLGAAAADAPQYAARLPAARMALAQATTLDSANAQAWADRAYATTLWALVEPAATARLGREAEGYANRALKITDISGEFWIRRGIARDMQDRWADASQDFLKAVSLAPNDALTWYYYADHLSRLKWASDLTNAALRFCLRLDPGNPAGLALRQRLAINPKAH